MRTAIGLKLPIYSAAHFLVDFACAYLMFGHLSNRRDFYLAMLIYNFCAFALQMPVGLAADRLGQNDRIAALGCLLVLAAYAITGGGALLPASMAGVGNALFHVGGGVDVLNISESRAAALGVFVSPGAMGIYLGSVLGPEQALPGLLLPLLVLLSALLIALTPYPDRRRPPNRPLSLALSSGRGPALALAGCFLVVVLRSYTGMGLTYPWKGAAPWGLLFTGAVVGGKAAGGFLCDRIGARRASSLSLGLAALLFLLPGLPLCGVAAVFLFNMTMPITLWALARAMPGAKGFGFGLLTFALFLGFLPAYFGHGSFSLALVPTLASALSLALLIPSLRAVD